MKKKLSLMLGLLAAASMAVTLEETGKEFIVKNENFTANFKKAQGGRVVLSVPKADCKVQNIAGNTVIYTNGERDTYQKSYAANDAPLSLQSQKCNAEIVTSNPSEVVLKFTSKLWCGEAVSTVSMDDSAAIRYHLTVSFSGTRLSKVDYTLGMDLSDPDGIFYPDAKRVVGVNKKDGSCVEGPSWKYAWHAKSKLGAGVIAPENKNLSGLEYMMQNLSEGGTSNYSGMKIVYSPLQKYGKKSKLDFNWQVIAGTTPEKAEMLADAVLGNEKSVKIHSYEIKKLTVRPGQDNTILAEVRNRTAADTAVKAKVFAVYGLDQEIQVAEAVQNVKAGTIQKMEIPVKFPSDVKLGVALRTELYDSKGKLLDKKTDFCSITDFVPRDTVFGFFSVAHCNREGSQDAWNRLQKKNYIGASEYYHWAPSTIFGLAPEYESWKPGVAIYDVMIYKKFIKKLVENAHSHGVGVYAWITGLWNYNVGLQHLDMLQYCENGQPNLYDGIIRKDGSRVIAMKPNIYTAERSGNWGKEMADSIEMFGWDGCRWDFSFLPSVANDPLFIGEKVADWYDNKGVPASKLYPDPDKTGVECLKAWRDAVAKRYPDFIYGANLGYREENRRSFPNYLKEASRKGLLIFEDMLGYNVEKWNTFEKWGSELALRADLVRPQGGTASVGIMRGLPKNSTSYHLAQYTAASSGVKWWAYNALNVDERSPERNRYFLRFAEYYFGTEFLRPEKSPVSLAKNQNVLFEPFVRQRNTASGREIVIPVVNMPDNNDYICVYHDTPPVRKNIAFKVKLKKGEKAEAWAMTPQNPEKAVRIPVADGIVTLPELTDACMILVKCCGGK